MVSSWNHTWFENLMDMTHIQKWQLFAVVALVFCIAFGLFQYARPSKDHGDQPIQVTLAAADLLAAFASSDSTDALVIGQVIAVQGTVQSVGAMSLVLLPGISCALAAPLTNPSLYEGTEVKVKGRLVGYDALFGEVQLDFASLIDS